MSAAPPPPEFRPYEPPRSDGVGGVEPLASPTIQLAGRRFVRAFTIWCVVMSIVAAGAWTLQVAALLRFGARQMIDSLVSFSALHAVRALAPSNACAAAVLALVSWGHGLKPTELTEQRPAMFQRAVLTTIVATPGLAVLLLGMTSLGMLPYDVSPGEFLSSAAELRVEDVLMAPVILGLHVAVTFPLTWLGIHAVAKIRLALAFKLIATCILLWLVRITLSYGFSAVYALFTPVNR